MEEKTRGGEVLSQKEKIRHLRKVFLKSKGLFALFSLALSLLLIIGSTYAWVTSEDQRVNRAATNTKRISARIDEDFQQVFHWTPGTTKQKALRVVNDGEIPAFVRVSLHEFFLQFETDVTDNQKDNPAVTNGNGNLVPYKTLDASAKYVQVKDTTTWETGRYYEVSASNYYKVHQAIVNPLDNPAKAYIYKDINRTLPLRAIHLNFQSGKVFDQSTPPTGGDSKYWYYEKGYFYYSEILQPNERTPDLLENVTLDPAYTNQYKGALYKLVPKMDARDLSKGLLSDWDIASSDFVYSLYQPLLPY